MGICNIQIKTDLKSKSYNTLQACKQGDTLILEFDIFDNSLMADLTGFTCDLRANKADGKGYQIINNVAVIVSTGKSTIKCPSSLTQFAGLLKLELTFTDTINSLQKTTFDINIQVDKSVIGNDDGSVPVVIITALEQLNANLAQITGKINEATQINNTLTNTISNANTVNSTVNTTIGNANTAKSNCDTATGNLNNAVNSANGTIEELKKTNTAYTEHINNLDIHVTKQQKINWDSNTLITQQLLNLVDILIGNTTNLVTENNDNFTTETGDILIV